MGRGLFKRLALVLISAGDPVCPLLLSLGVASEAPRTKLGAGLSAEAAKRCFQRWEGLARGQSLNAGAPEDTG